MGKQVIVVIKTHEGYVATLASDPEVWAAHDSTAAAIGDMIQHHPRAFNVEIQYQKPETQQTS